MKNQLRDYQIKLIQDVFAEWELGSTAVMAQLPTGGGKTICFVAIAKTFLERQKRVLILAHREELITQAASKIESILGVEPGIIKAGYQPDTTALIQVGSVQSVVSKSRLSKIGQFDLVIIDEAHHFNAKNSYGKVLNQFPNAKVLGVTATPRRLDGKGFEDCFDSLVTGISVQELINQEHLSQFKLFAANNLMSTDRAKTQNGDWKISDIADSNDAIQLSGNLVQTYRQYARDKTNLVFAINVEHSKAIATAFNQAGIEAAHLDGNSLGNERREILRAFSQGKIKVLTNCALFTEGFDLPHLECVQIARPTKSLTLWLQMVGRSLRTAHGKDVALILDHTANHQILGLPNQPRIWTLDGKEAVEKNKFGSEAIAGSNSEKKQITEIATSFTEVDTSFDSQWVSALKELIEMQKEKGYKRGWIGFKLKELRPPLEVWKLAAEYLGYQPGWAWHQFNDNLI